jgi:hypothetical protein
LLGSITLLISEKFRMNFKEKMKSIDLLVLMKDDFVIGILLFGFLGEDCACFFRFVLRTGGDFES